MKNELFEMEDRLREAFPDHLIDCLEYTVDRETLQLYSPVIVDKQSTGVRIRKEVLQDAAEYGENVLKAVSDFLCSEIHKVIEKRKQS